MTNEEAQAHDNANCDCCLDAAFERERADKAVARVAELERYAAHLMHRVEDLETELHERVEVAR